MNRFGLVCLVLAGSILGGILANSSLFQSPVMAAAHYESPIAYAQLSSLTTQLPENSNPTVVATESNEGAEGIEFTDKTKKGDITIKTPGVYFVMAAAQVGRQSQDSEEHVDLWIRQNGKDVPNSNTRQSIKETKFTAVLVSQGILVVKENDVINVMMSVSNGGKGVGLIASKPQGEPAIPSLILSLYKIK